MAPLFFERFPETWKLPVQRRFSPTRVFFQTASRWSAGYHPYSASLSPPAPVLILFARPFPASPPSPALTPTPPQLRKIHPHPPPSLFRSSAGPAAPCWVKWTMPVSQEPRVPRLAQPGSAQLSVLNLLCDYCQSETPPPRRSAMMGTIWHRAQPAMKAGIREQKRYRNPGWGRDTEAGEKYC